MSKKDARSRVLLILCFMNRIVVAQINLWGSVCLSLYYFIFIYWWQRVAQMIPKLKRMVVGWGIKSLHSHSLGFSGGGEAERLGLIMGGRF